MASDLQMPRHNLAGFCCAKRCPSKSRLSPGANRASRSPALMSLTLDLLFWAVFPFASVWGATVLWPWVDDPGVFNGMPSYIGRA